MAADYCTVDDVKLELPDASMGTSYDALFAGLVTRASRAIDRYTNREPGAYAVTNDTTRYFTPTTKQGRPHLYRMEFSDNTLGVYMPGAPPSLWIGELATTPTSVAMSISGKRTPSDYTALATTDYMLWPYNAAAEGTPYRRLDLDLLYGAYRLFYAYPQAVKIVGKFGYSTTVPDELVQATITQAIRWFKRSQQGFTDTSASTELGQLVYTKKLDPEVGLTIEHFRRVVV